MMSVILGLAGDFWPYIAAAGAAIVAMLTAYGKGRKDANTKHIVKKAKSDEKSHDRINKVTPVDPADRSSIRERLRKHSK